jgi:hypothetical protein
MSGRAQIIEIDRTSKSACYVALTHPLSETLKQQQANLPTKRKNPQAGQYLARVTTSMLGVGVSSKQGKGRSSSSKRGKGRSSSCDESIESEQV